ncbi:hypothetical protein PanWU01x14_057170 [Parasponia andersonii]|uniref:Uncharacterized protein n=1 Tax=Parasponia andersonii TaxID=3476 RepID=A0A2P5DJV1_PARAD|nr:hypothetical protein PanWU01x14_057170 [Parasponia andersonii]
MALGQMGRLEYVFVTSEWTGGFSYAFMISDKRAFTCLRGSS